MANVEKITVSLPKDLVGHLRALSEEGHIESVSAYVTQAVQDRMERQHRASLFLHRAAEQVQETDSEGWRKAQSWADGLYAQFADQDGTVQGAA
ncbi:hypothetical protein SAMN05216276_107819 [Streptosporangium subroseum]|uniref:Uncharacterized protein n=1 Tax=Streptosporangium subroseum TaxID=106412 RepID=A0A239P1Q4_9ACTN|nr:ribbon-helix-helix domain-containing protein [Streptosporangium subroseum]SNT60558.1 hypothetical protein SAMN05216276_107819 [Streptosporangium subroseum]